MDRTTGETETWGSVQMKIVTDMVRSFQNKSKRLIEDIGTLWLQLNGIQGTLKLTHNPIEYQSEIQKWEAQNEKDKHYQTAELQGWINTDEAAQGAVGADKATGQKQETRNSSDNNPG